MLNDEDIKKLSSILATKSDLDVFKSEVKSEFDGVKKDIKDVRNDLDVFKSEVKSEFDGVKKDIKDVRNDLDSKFIVLKNDIQDVKKDVEGLREAIQGMMVSIDNLAKVISDLRLEYAAITHQLNRHEGWIKQIAEKVGLNLVME